MALTTVTVHIDIRQPVTNVPAVGTVVFNTLIELRDVVANVTYSPMTFTATLVAGQATITLPATDNPDLLPASWVYQVWINTDILNDVQYMQIPFAPGTTEFADLTPVDYDPCTGVLAPTPIPPDSSDLFVKKTGDTMTGNLIINANLQVNGSASASYQGVSGDIMRLLSTGLSTGVVSGGEFTPNAGDPTKLDISAMTGWIVDYNPTAVPSVTNPKITYVSIPAQVALAPTVGIPTGATWWLCNSAGVISQQISRPTPTQRRNNIVLGVTAQEANIIIEDQTLPTNNSQPVQQFIDLADSLGNFNILGNTISSNGVNLTFQRSAGTVFARAFSLIPTYRDPNISSLPAQAPVNFRHITAVPGTAQPLTTILNVGSYDPGGSGVVTLVPGGVNTATNFRVWGFAANGVNDQVLVQYGQNTYSSLANAVAAIGSTNYTPAPVGLAVGIFLGWISVIKSATDLSNTSQAVFTKASKFATP